jgi:HAE1 family hydrophobic/amphiphilic exporter-1
MNFTLNMMTTLGLSLSIGILVDDAIVVIENIYRHLAMGKNAIQAAKDATAEIGLAVFATTLTICAVFVPVAFMEGIIGRFFFQFGLTVTFAVLISLFVAFTLTPMLSSRMLRDHDHNADPGMIGRWLNKVDARYRTILNWCLHHRWLTLGIGVASFVVSIGMLAFIPVSFFPREDRSTFMLSITLPENTSIAVTKAKALRTAHLLKEYPGVSEVVSAVAAGNEKKPNFARLTVNLVAPGDRNYSQEEMMARVRTDFASFFAQDHTEFDVGIDNNGQGRSQAVQLVFMGDDREELAKVTDEVAQFMKSHIEGLVDVATTKAKPRQEYSIDLNLGLAKDVALSTTDMAMGTRTLFEGQKVGQIEDKSGRYDIRVKASPHSRTSVQDVTAVSFASAKGSLLALSSVSNVKSGLAASTIERFDGRNQITVLANYTGRNLNGVTQQINAYVKAHVPEHISTKWEGEADIMAKSIVSMLTALLLAVLLIYMILCAQYERYLAPFVIMMALPLSLTGAFGALLLTGQYISVYTMIGVILLMGIVTKNGILLIDFTLHKMNEGLSVYDALMEAGPVRLRPILMTTFAAGFGMLPVAIGHGEGGEAKSPMGIAVMGGLFVSTLLTLIVVPCLFSLMEGFRRAK